MHNPRHFGINGGNHQQANDQPNNSQNLRYIGQFFAALLCFAFIAFCVICLSFNVHFFNPFVFVYIYIIAKCAKKSSPKYI